MSFNPQAIYDELVKETGVDPDSMKSIPNPILEATSTNLPRPVLDLQPESVVTVQGAPTDPDGIPFPPSNVRLVTNTDVDRAALMDAVPKETVTRIKRMRKSELLKYMQDNNIGDPKLNREESLNTLRLNAIRHAAGIPGGGINA